MQMRGDFSTKRDNGEATFLGVIMDVTVRRRMEEASRDAERRKDEFLATLAHELRNPLAPIRNGLTVLRNTDNVEVSKSIHSILDRQVNHITRLIDDLLEISRFALGKIEVRRAAVDLKTVLNRAVEMSQPFIEAGRHRLELSMPPEPMMVHADGVRLTQVFSNILINASKYTLEGGTISLNVEKQGDHVVVAIRDSGIGIPPHMLTRIFELFTQVDSYDSQANRGLGVGLAMARLLVDLHGGTIEARSEGLGKGSEFLVRLPVLPNLVVSDPNPDEGAQGVLLMGRRILVVDDNRDSADTLSLLLEMANAEVRTAYDGHMALRMLGDYHADIVILDIGMPEMDGYATAIRIRQDFPDLRTTLIALTGFGQEWDKRKSLASGFAHHVTKPADHRALLSLLHSIECNGSAHLSH
jgi:CheY-like chemotaxis protein